MRRRQLPSRLRHRVRHFERQSWLTTGGVDEMELIKDLPEGLRRDIKRYLCLDLMKKVLKHISFVLMSLAMVRTYNIFWVLNHQLKLLF